jgi:hypothetical protein
MVLAYPTKSERHDLPELDYLIIFHGPSCEFDSCQRKPGDRMAKTFQTNKEQCDYEWGIAKNRIDDITDHVGGAIRYGPHVNGIERMIQ